MRAHDASLTTWTERGGDRLDISLVANDADVSEYTRIGYIGTPMILQGKYDPDQLWLPFMQGAILRHAPRDHYVPTPRKHEPRIVRKMAARPIQIQGRFLHMFAYDSTQVDQGLLPFVEYRYVPSGEFSRAKWHWLLDKHNHPVWRHTKSQVLVNMTEEEFAEWGAASFTGRFSLNGAFVYFEKEIDWLFTKLRFFGEEKIESA